MFCMIERPMYTKFPSHLLSQVTRIMAFLLRPKDNFTIIFTLYMQVECLIHWDRWWNNAVRWEILKVYELKNKFCSLAVIKVFLYLKAFTIFFKTLRLLAIASSFVPGWGWSCQVPIFLQSVLTLEYFQFHNDLDGSSTKELPQHLLLSQHGPQSLEQMQVDYGIEFVAAYQ